MRESDKDIDKAFNEYEADLYYITETRQYKQIMDTLKSKMQGLLASKLAQREQEIEILQEELADTRRKLLASGEDV